MLGSQTTGTLASLLLDLAHMQAEGEDYRPGRRVDVSTEKVFCEVRWVSLRLLI